MSTQKLISLLLFTFFMYVQPSVGQSSIFNKLESNDVLEMTIKTDLTALLTGAGKSTYLPAELSYEDANKQTIHWKIETRQRGKYRRRICDFPPLKLRFDKKDLADKGLTSFHTLKLVTHCLENAYESKTNLLKEYLVYQLYEELTEKSFKTQLVKVTYIDTEQQTDKIIRYGFLIENEDEMAHRLEASICDCMNPDFNSINPKEEMLVAMFQFMVGNEDWDIQMGRNIKLMSPNSGGAMYVVPYDFDFSGLVNTSYAIPNQDLGLMKVTDRAFQGFYQDKVAIQAVLDYFQLKKDRFYEIVKNFKVLDHPSRKLVIQYLDDFFLEMEYDQIIKHEVPLGKMK